MLKYCWKCQKISKFSKSKIPYVSKITGGTKYNCDNCIAKYQKEHNIKSVERVETPNSIFSSSYKFILND